MKTMIRGYPLASLVALSRVHAIAIMEEFPRSTAGKYFASLNLHGSTDEPPYDSGLRCYVPMWSYTRWMFIFAGDSLSGSTS
jgi:hypothetical protein